MTWLAVLGTLLGTIIGAAATLFAQQIAAREADKREQLQRRAALRLERKNQIDAFLDAAQEAERIASNRDHLNYDAITRASNNIWVNHKRLALICSDDLAGPLGEFADALNITLWDGAPEGVSVWKHVADSTWRFRDAARREIQWTE
jgi:hypothetical protein